MSEENLILLNGTSNEASLVENTQTENSTLTVDSTVENRTTQPASQIENRNEPSTSNSTLFSNIVKTVKYPKKDQAIVFPVVDGLQIKDYVIALSKIVGPKNITYCSRMSNNRICIYLSSKEIVQSYIINHGGLDIGDIHVQARKLITPAKRIVISNVAPCIPCSIIEEAIKQANLKPVSPISFISAGIGLEELKHVMSFRRQIYIADIENQSIPTSLVITFENENYRIFLSDDQITCFKCKTIGHIASRCPNAFLDPPLDKSITDSNKRPLPTSSVSSDTHTPTLMDISGLLNNTPTANTLKDTNKSNQPAKRSRIDFLSEQNTSEEKVPQNKSMDQEIDLEGFQIPKKSKTATPENKSNKNEATQGTSGVLNELASMWPSDEHILDFCHFSDFLREVKGHDHPLEVSKKYTNDTQSLIALLQKAVTYTKKRAFKQRLRRLVNNLRKNVSSEENRDFDQESQSSQMSVDILSSREDLSSY